MYLLCAFSAGLHVSTNSCVIVEIYIMVYYSLSIWFFVKKYFTSMHMYLDVTSEMALFTWSFVVVKYDVGVMTSPG